MLQFRLSRAPLRPLLLAAAGWCVLAPPAGAGPLPESIRPLVRPVIEAHPEVRAARERLRAAEARRDGAARPLYNPEIELGAQRTLGVSTALDLGIAQAIDWHDKREARLQAARLDVSVARAALAETRSRLAGELLAALRACDSARERLALVRAQHRLLSRFSRLTAQRAAAGDVPRSARALARMAVSRLTFEVAAGEAGLDAASAAVRALGGAGCPQEPVFPALPSVLPAVAPEDIGRRHPLLVRLRAEADRALAEVRLADAERRADPVIGVALGRDGGDRSIGLSVALPLQVRNDGRETVRAAHAERNAALAALHAERARLLARVAGGRARVERMAAAWAARDASAEQAFDRNELERLWRAGELDTADYLQQLQEALDMRAAAQALRAEWWTAWLETWADSGELARWIDEE